MDFEKYERAEMEIIEFEAEDVMMSSGFGWEEEEKNLGEPF